MIDITVESSQHCVVAGCDKHAECHNIARMTVTWNSASGNTYASMEMVFYGILMVI